MVVKTAQTSAARRRRPELDARVHPRQPPARLPRLRQGRRVPAPGPDVPLRPAGSRASTFPKRTFEKPIPISPTIALDRERCILCYRCTRFSSDVAEDGQLVARDRGAQSIIATFEDQPYRAPFSGNVIELCPVGALTSTQYRFEARPWEIQNVPTVCGLCPVGCNVAATTREGKVQARRLAQPSRGRRGLALRQGPLRLHAPVAPTTGSSTRCRRVGRRGATRRSPGTMRSTRPSDCSAPPAAASSTALSGSETVEQAYALAKLAAQGLDAHCAVLPEETSPALDAFRLPLSAIRDAELVVVLGDDPVVERAPIVDLWIKAARRAGAEVVESELGAADGRRGLARSDDELGKRLRESRARGPHLVGRRRARRRDLAALAGELGLRREAGSGAFHLPDTANGRGVADAWAAAADGEPRRSGADRAPDRLRRRGRREPGRARARRARRAGARDLDVPRRSSPAGPTSSCRARATSSATART